MLIQGEVYRVATKGLVRRPRRVAVRGPHGRMSSEKPLGRWNPHLETKEMCIMRTRCEFTIASLALLMAGASAVTASGQTASFTIDQVLGMLQT